MRPFFISDTQPGSRVVPPGTDLLDLAFEQALVWTAELLSLFFRHCRNPRIAAAAYARRRVAAGDLRSARLDSVPVPGVCGPLATSRDRSRPDFERLSYYALQRLSRPARPTTVYWPSGQFARTRASWTGSDSLPNPLQISHSLLCTAVWLHLLTETPDIALDAWTSERRLQFHARREAGGGPIPDALIARNGEAIAIEVVGKYPANWIEHHVDQFETHFDGWELW